MIDLFHADAAQFDWKAALDGRQIDCIITDPPYGINYASNRSYDRTTKSRSRALHREIANDLNVNESLGLFWDVMEELRLHTADECEMYVFTQFNVLDEWLRMVNGFSTEPTWFGFACKAMLVWDKQALGSGDIDGSWVASYELILYLKKGRRDMNRQRPSVLRFDRVPTMQRIHPTEKPVALLEELIKVSTNPGDTIVDPFAGSASLLEAANRTGRRAVGTEMDKGFFDAAKQRMSQGVLFAWDH